jgi:hypothetical protein
VCAGEYRKQSNGSVLHGPKMPGGTLSQFPFTGTAAFTALTPDNNYSSVSAAVAPECIFNLS